MLVGILFSWNWGAIGRLFHRGLAFTERPYRLTYGRFVSCEFVYLSLNERQSPSKASTHFSVGATCGRPRAFTERPYEMDSSASQNLLYESHSFRGIFGGGTPKICGSNSSVCCGLSTLVCYTSEQRTAPHKFKKRSPNANETC